MIALRRSRKRALLEMKPVRTYQRRTALLTRAGAYAALLYGASPALAVPFLGATGSFTVMGPSLVANTRHNTLKNDHTDSSGLGLIEDAMVTALKPASALLFIGGLISMAGFAGVRRRTTDQSDG